MDADDPRHGTRAGYYAHRRDNQGACDHCKRAAARNFNQRRLAIASGIPTSYPAHTVTRRIQALVANGWTHGQIASRIGVGVPQVAKWERITAQVRPVTYQKVSAVYEQMCMVVAPDGWSASYARNRAARLGFASPLMWDDIDNDEAPIGKRRAGTEYDSADIVDEATVLRILSGEVLPANAAERREAMRRWLAAGNSERSLCERMGWKDGRYVTREDAA